MDFPVPGPPVNSETVCSAAVRIASSCKGAYSNPSPELTSAINLSIPDIFFGGISAIDIRRRAISVSALYSLAR